MKSPDECPAGLDAAGTMFVAASRNEIVARAGALVTGHSDALAQYGNVTANQLMNTITNPRGTGWMDAYGRNISFKCNGVFIPGDPSDHLSYEWFTNGSLWAVRTKWSNAAYRAGTGLLSPWGQPGCIY